MTGAAPKVQNVPESHFEQASRNAEKLKLSLTEFVTPAKRLKQKLDYVIQRLGYPEKISTDLKRLNSDLDDLKTLLSAVSTIPTIKPKAENLIKGITKIKKPIADARKLASDFAKRIDPIKKKIQSINDKLVTLIRDVESLKSKLEKFTIDLNNANICVQSLPPGRNKENLEQRLEEVADHSSLVMSKLDEELNKALTKMDAGEKRIKSDVEPLYRGMEPVENEIKQLQKRASAAMAPLGDLKSYMSRKLCFSFPYPNPSWRNPFRTSRYEVCVSVSTIVNGKRAVEKFIQDLLSKTLWTILKKLGLSGFINGLAEKAKSGINTIANRLNLNFRVELPGLNEFKTKLRDLEHELITLPQYTAVDFAKFNKLIGHMNKSLGGMANIYSSCKKLGD